MNTAVAGTDEHYFSQGRIHSMTCWWKCSWVRTSGHRRWKHKCTTGEFGRHATKKFFEKFSFVWSKILWRGLVCRGIHLLGSVCCWSSGRSSARLRAVCCDTVLACMDVIYVDTVEFLSVNNIRACNFYRHWSTLCMRWYRVNQLYYK